VASSSEGRIGRFDIEGEAASGGVGTVFRARDPRSGQLVAVKVIRGYGDADLQRFGREARILAQIQHPGVVRYIEHGVNGPGDGYLVMEWLDGEDLRDRLARGRLSVAESVTLGRRVATALAVVHAHGLIHRDIKPGNLFLPGGVVAEVKIIDFGLARGDRSLGPTATGAVVGTPAYMAPEQARGERGVDARADIYSLGCVLFKALTGRAPFQGQELLAVLTRVLFEEPPRISELCPSVPALLDDLVARMLAKDPQGRPASASAVAEALSALGPFSETVEEATPASAPPSGGMMGEQRRVAMLLIGGGALTSPPDRADAAIGACVRRHSGRLDRLLDGTRVVAFTGQAMATDQAACAARCALALRTVLPVEPMVLAACRSEVDQRLPVGAAVDRAAKLLRQRIEATTVGGRPATALIVVDEVTAALLDSRFEVQSGIDGLTLHGVRELESGARRLLGKETPFVGRDWELSSVLSLFERCVDDELALALVVEAPAGGGKSRLGREVVRAIVEGRPDVEVWRGRGDPLRAGSALELLAQVIRSACGQRESETILVRRERLRQRTALHVPAPDALRVARFLGEIVGTPFPDDDSPELQAARRDARIMGDQTRRAWSDFLAGECAAGPRLIVIEDLQWADPSTVRFLDDALKDLSRLPWMVLGLARPEVATLFPRLWQDRNVQEIRLKPLPSRASERLVREVLGEQVSPATATRLAARADGNPFYLEELIRAVAADDGRPQRCGPRPSLGAAEPGAVPAEAFHDGASGDDLRPKPRAPAEPEETLPETVLAMVQTRLEGLDADARRALRAASIFGEVFWLGAVTALLGDGSAPLPSDDWVDTLVTREVLGRRSESRFAGEPEIAFRHGMLREGAYAMLTERDRIAGHRLAGEWLEVHGESDPMLLARHFELGQEPARAGALYLRAAEQALRGADLDAALKHAERALVSGLGAEPRLHCLGMLCEAHGWRAEWERAAEYAGQVIALAEPGSAPWVQGITAQQAAAIARGRPADFLEALYTLMGVDPAPRAVSTVVGCLSLGISVCCVMVQFTLAEGILRQIDVLVAGLSDRDLIARGWRHLSHAYWETFKTGALGEALEHVEASRVSFAAACDRHRVQLVSLFAARVRWNLGMFAEAERELRAIVPTGDQDVVAHMRSLYLTLVLIDRGALEEARELALRRVNGKGSSFLSQAEGRWLLGHVAARSGDLDAASDAIGAVLDTLRFVPLLWQLAATTLAAVELERGRVEAAVVLSRQVVDAIAVHGGCGDRIGRAHLVHAESLYASGARDTADAVLAAARRDLLARAARIACVEARRCFLAELPEHARMLALAAERLGPPEAAA
jgi:hypothetical protein